ncbi:MAG: DUF4325 domain-containing protein [Anaerolineaceae bacterium]|nr:DUF4325 domain-containing protein [Anaerolineaceae bacterium]
MNKIEEIKEFIIQYVRQNPVDIVDLLADKFSCSRQSALGYLREFCEQGWISNVEGTYVLDLVKELCFDLPITQTLNADTIWLEKVFPIFQKMPVNVVALCQFGFTEILSNAIEFSGGNQVCIQVKIWPDQVQLIIADDGIGLFESLKQALEYEHISHLVLELLKGKYSTHPEKHAGTGLFYAARLFDWFSVSSKELRLERKANRFQLFQSEQAIQGTGVIMQTRTRSDRTLVSVFDQYGDGLSAKSLKHTEVPVFLVKSGTQPLVKPSQAEILLKRLNLFEVIILDFEYISTTSIEFLDEIFRTFLEENPKVQLIPVNTNKRIQHMIQFFA